MKSSEFIDTDLVSIGSIPGKSAKESKAPSDPSGGANGQQNGRAELEARVEQARQQMLELRRQQEELEKQRQELEELRRREEDFEQGKAEMLEELSRTVGLIEQEEFEHHKRSTMLTNFREIYQDYIRQLNDIRESEWTSADLKIHLNKAFTVVEGARAELNRGRAQLSAFQEGAFKMAGEGGETLPQTPLTHSQPQEPFSFELEFKRGLARYLPVIIFGILALIILLAKK